MADGFKVSVAASNNSDVQNVGVHASKASDEYFTPAYAVEPLVKHLKAAGFENVLCPFDTAESAFVSVLEKHGFNVMYSHIEDGGDFFKIDQDLLYEMDVHVIVSNPPYSLKNEVLTKLYDLDVPFATLLGVVGMFESKARVDLFTEHLPEVLYLDKRVSFVDRFNGETRNPPFQSGYFCHKVLRNQIVIERIEKPRVRMTKSEKVSDEK